MSKHKKRLTGLSILLICLAAVILSAIYKKQNETIVLELGMFVGSNWDVANANSYVIIDNAIERFEQEHKNVKVHYTSGIRKGDYSEWFSQKTLHGNTPDVFMVLSSDFNQFSSLGILKSLDFLMQNDPEFDSADFYSTTLSTGIYSDSQYALPYETVPTLMFVNKTLLNESGCEVPGNDWTWNDMLRICRMVAKDSDGDSILDRFGTYNFNWTNAVYSNGGALFDADGSRSYFNSKNVVDAIKFTQEIYTLNEGQRVTQEDFDNGNVAFMPLSFSEYRTYKSYPYKIKKYTDFQWDCIPMPAGEQGGNVSEVNTLLMGISENTKHAALAWDFLKLLTYDEDIQMSIFKHSQGASVLRNITHSNEAADMLMRDMEESEMVIDKDVLNQVIENGFISPKIQKYDEAMSLAEGEISKIIEDQRNVESSLKILQRTINKHLKQ